MCIWNTSLPLASGRKGQMFCAAIYRLMCIDALIIYINVCAYTCGYGLDVLPRNSGLSRTVATKMQRGVIDAVTKSDSRAELRAGKRILRWRREITRERRSIKKKGAERSIFFFERLQDKRNKSMGRSRIAKNKCDIPLIFGRTKS